MKKVLFYSLILLTGLAVSSCDKIAKSFMGATTGEKVDYKLLSQPQELEKWYNTIAEQLGESASVTDEISLRIDKEEGDKANLMVSTVCQSKTDKHNVVETLYSSDRGWQSPVTKKIEVIIGNAEDFNLEDELFDLKEIPYANLQKIVDDALQKNKDETKYEYQFVKLIVIKKNTVEVDITGKLKSNGVEKEKYYKTDFSGKEK